MSKTYKIDRDLVRKVVYATHGGPNPYPVDTRKHRLYENISNQFHMMEELDSEMEMFYGPMNATKRYPTPLKAEDVDHTLKGKK